METAKDEQRTKDLLFCASLHFQFPAARAFIGQWKIRKKCFSTADCREAPLV
jgi:hypothetical protein